MEPSPFDGAQNHFHGLLVAAQIGSEPTLVPNRRVEALLGKDLLEVVEDLDTTAKALGEAVEADGHHHELLDVDVVRGVGAAIQDVHHGHREHV